MLDGKRFAILRLILAYCPPFVETDCGVLDAAFSAYLAIKNQPTAVFRLFLFAKR